MKSFDFLSKWKVRIKCKNITTILYQNNIKITASFIA